MCRGIGNVDADLAIRSASFSIASEALKPAVKGRTALDRAGTNLETGRRLRTSGKGRPRRDAVGALIFQAQKENGLCASCLARPGSSVDQRLVLIQLPITLVMTLSWRVLLILGVERAWLVS